MQIAAAPNPALDQYYSTLQTYANLGVTHEQGIRTAFRSLIETFAKPVGWTLVEEHTLNQTLRMLGSPRAFNQNLKISCP